MVLQATPTQETPQTVTPKTPKLLTRTQVLEQLTPFNDLELRNVRDSSTGRVLVDTGRIAIRPSKGARSIAVADEGAASMLKVLGLPLGLSKALSSATFSDVLSEMLAKKGSYSLVVKDDTVVDIAPYHELPTLKPERVLDVTEKAMPVQGYNRTFSPSRQSVALEVIGEKTAPVVVGDLVQAGVLIEFSPLNITMPLVQSYAMRLACTNGMTTNTILSKYQYGGDGDDVWQFFRQNVKKAYGSLGKIVSTWKRLANDRIPDKERALIIEGLIKQAALPSKAANTVRAMALDNPPHNHWDAMQFISYASSHLLEAQQIRHAQNSLAHFADEREHERYCPVCRKIR